MTYTEPEASAAPPEGGQASDAGQGPASTETFDWTPYESNPVPVKVDGEDLTVPFNEVRDGYMRQSDYTRKTQEIAERQKQYEFYDSLGAALQADPQATLEYLAEQLGVNAPALGEQIDPDLLTDDERRIADLESRLSQTQDWQTQQQVEQEIADLQDEFGDQFDIDPLKVLEHAVKQDMPNLRAAFADMVFNDTVGELKTYKTAEQQAAEERTQGNDNARAAARAAGIVEGGHGVQGGAGQSSLGVRPSLKDAYLAAKDTVGFSYN